MSTAAAVSSKPQSFEAVAAIQIADRDKHPDSDLKINDPFITIYRLNGERCKFVALLDTGSPVSFIRHSIFDRYMKSRSIEISPANIFRNLSKQALNITGVVKAEIEIEQKVDVKYKVDFHILEDNIFKTDFILGRDFLDKQKLTVVYNPVKFEDDSRNLFAVLLLCVDSMRTRMQI